MKNYKVKSSGKNKVVSFTLVYNLPQKFSKNEVYRLATTMDPNCVGLSSFGGRFYWTAADYQTGLSLEKNNNSGIKVKSGGYKYSGKKKYTGKYGSWITHYKKATVKITITYPKNYKNLCVLVGGYANGIKNQKVLSADDFYNGKIPFKDCKLIYTTKKGFNYGMKLK